MQEKKTQSVNEIVIDSLEITPSDEHTVITLIAVAKDNRKNKQHKISCHDRRAFWRGYAYDQGKDCYIVNCAAFYELGMVSCSIDLKSKDGQWQTKYPVPKQLIIERLTSEQRRKYNNFIDEYSPELYDTEFVQFTYMNH